MFVCVCFLNQEQLKPIARTSRSDDVLILLDDAETVEDTPQWFTQCSDAAVVVGFTFTVRIKVQ